MFHKLGEKIKYGLKLGQKAYSTLTKIGQKVSHNIPRISHELEEYGQIIKNPRLEAFGKGLRDGPLVPHAVQSKLANKFLDTHNKILNAGFAASDQVHDRVMNSRMFS